MPTTEPVLLAILATVGLLITTLPSIIGAVANYRQGNRIQSDIRKNTTISQAAADKATSAATKVDENTKLTGEVYEKVNSNLETMQAQVDATREELRHANEKLADVLKAMVNTVTKVVDATATAVPEVPPPQIVVDQKGIIDRRKG